jgi:hypothetical protein
MANSRDISFASFNLYNLQLLGAAMYQGKKYTQEQYEGKIGWTADMLRRLDADIIGFQELWSREALEQAFAAAGLADEYELAFIKPGAWNGIAVAAAVRKPWQIIGQERFKAFPIEMTLTKRNVSGEETTAEAENEEEGIGPDQEDEAADIRIYKFSRSPLQAR